MSDHEQIRLNVQVKADVDQFLFNDLNAISERSRVRRLLHLASLGLLIDNNRGNVGLNVGQNNLIKNEVLSAYSSSDVAANSTGFNLADDDVDDLLLIGEVFGNGDDAIEENPLQ